MKWAAAGIGFAAVLLFVFGVGEPPSGDAAESARPGVGVPARIEAAGGEPDPHPTRAGADTAAPDGLLTDANGRLRITLQTRHLFEYFLASAPKANRQHQIARLEGHIRNVLAKPAPLAFAQAMDLAQRFIAYMDAHDALLPTYGFARQAGAVSTADLPRIAEFLRARSDMRRQYLGPEVARDWYGAEEDREQRVLASLRSGEGQQVEPAPVPRAQALTQQLQSLRAQGASADQMREFLRANVGEDAVRRFDAQRQDDAFWAARYENYRAAAAHVTNHGGLDPDEAARQLEAVRRQHFANAAEAARAAMLDRDSPATAQAPRPQ
ncbi:lipase secretion chaperone [Cupriavidus agavae]|uniref:Lipase helper protein n=1 Tax=Cupriavidus agavae TaxID=1001822 RepID=A0A4V2FI62_9BURK|nr:lipase secretion chaperone [Cupriavidus agavae]RZT42669.1 lipase chaperone LimK [Cupriavidus agavae]